MKNKRFIISCIFFLIIVFQAFADEVVHPSTWIDVWKKSVTYDLEKSPGDAYLDIENYSDDYIVAIFGARNIYADDGTVVATNGTTRQIKKMDYYHFSINENSDVLQFVTTEDVAAHRNYKIMVNPRVQIGSVDKNFDGSKNVDPYDSYGDNVTLSPTYHHGIIESGKMEFDIPVYGKDYKEIHGDTYIAFPTFDPDDLYESNNYTASFTIKISAYYRTIMQTTRDGGNTWSDSDYTIDTSPTSTSSVLVPLRGRYKEDGGGSYTFKITPDPLASYYPLDAADATTLKTVGNVEFLTFSSKVKDTISPYAIGVGPSSNWTDDSGLFKFTKTSSSSTETIEYYVQLAGTESYCSSLNTGELKGTEGHAFDSSTTESSGRFLIIPQVSEGEDAGGKPVYRYKFKGNLQIRLKEPVTNKSSGIYSTTIYVFLITR